MEIRFAHSIPTALGLSLPGAPPPDPWLSNNCCIVSSSALVPIPVLIPCQYLPLICQRHGVVSLPGAPPPDPWLENNCCILLSCAHVPVPVLTLCKYSLHIHVP